MSEFTPTQGRYFSFVHAYIQGFGYPRCLDGARACPPEDIGGVWGFVDFLQAIADPDHVQHEEFLEWHGPFDPEEFDATKATQQMKKGLPVL